MNSFFSPLSSAFPFVLASSHLPIKMFKYHHVKKDFVDPHLSFLAIIVTLTSATANLLEKVVYAYHHLFVTSNPSLHLP